MITQYHASGRPCARTSMHLVSTVSTKFFCKRIGYKYVNAWYHFVLWDPPQLAIQSSALTIKPQHLCHYAYYVKHDYNSSHLLPTLRHRETGDAKFYCVMGARAGLLRKERAHLVSTRK